MFGVGLRALVYLRSLARSAERLSDSLASLAQDSRSRWERELGPRPKPKPTMVTTLDIDAAEARWERVNRAAAEGVDLPEDE